MVSGLSGWRFQAPNPKPFGVRARTGSEFGVFRGTGAPGVGFRVYGVLGFWGFRV